MTAKLGLKKTDTVLCETQSIFRYLQPFRLTSVTDRRTDERTDMFITNAALNYVVRPKMMCV